MVEHTLPTKNQLRLDGTHSGDGISIWEMAEHTLLTGNQLGSDGTHSAGRKLTQDMPEHTLPTGNQPKTWWNTLFRPEMVWFFLPNGSYARDTQAQGACALRIFFLKLPYRRVGSF